MSSSDRRIRYPSSSCSTVNFIFLPFSNVISIESFSAAFESCASFILVAAVVRHPVAHISSLAELIDIEFSNFDVIVHKPSLLYLASHELDSKIIGKNIDQINMSENTIVCCIIRNNDFIFDTSNMLFEQNDRLVCLVNKKDVKQIEDLFE